MATCDDCGSELAETYCDSCNPEIRKLREALMCAADDIGKNEYGDICPAESGDCVLKLGDLTKCKKVTYKEMLGCWIEKWTRKAHEKISKEKENGKQA